MTLAPAITSDTDLVAGIRRVYGIRPRSLRDALDIMTSGTAHLLLIAVDPTSRCLNEDQRLAIATAVVTNLEDFEDARFFDDLDEAERTELFDSLARVVLNGPAIRAIGDLDWLRQHMRTTDLEAEAPIRPFIDRVTSWLSQEHTLIGLDHARITTPGIHEIREIGGLNYHLDALAAMGTERLLQAIAEGHTGAIRLIVLIYAGDSHPLIDSRVCQAAQAAFTELRL